MIGFRAGIRIERKNWVANGGGHAPLCRASLLGISVFLQLGVMAVLLIP